MNPQEARDAGMALAENAADSRLVAIVDQVIAEFNASGREWSANDIRDRLPAVNPPVIGARVKAAMMRRPMEMRRVGWVISDLESTKSKTIGEYRGITHPETLFDEAAS